MPILTSQSDLVRAGSGTWQEHMKWAIRDTKTLSQRLNLPNSERVSAKAASQFPVFAPLPLLSRVSSPDLSDPILRQIVPLVDEDSSPEHFSLDPLGESTSTLQQGLLQKYVGRVLLITTGACAVHCRYCFRRHFPYQESPTSPTQWQPAIEQIAADSTITEVILSGGDPLTIVDGQLEKLVQRLSEVPHLKRLRIHTRLPIMIPQRVTDRLLKMISDNRLQTIVVIHANHANELDDQVQESVSLLRKSGATLLNQSVLLRGVNDDAKSLVNLSERLLGCGVLPYYLHQLDPVIGTSHFEVAKERGVELISQMRASLPGYAVPRYVKELEGEPNKTVWA